MNRVDFIFETEQIASAEIPDETLDGLHECLRQHASFFVIMSGSKELIVNLNHVKTIRVTKGGD